MLEARYPDIFSYPNADAICFTSNGKTNRCGDAIMGAGVALAFKLRFPNLPEELGYLLKNYGNHVYLLNQEAKIEYKGNKYFIINFPTKNDWWDPSDLDLIKQSCKEIVKLADTMGFQKIVLTPPGCGNGKLDYEKQVKPLIARYLDDRFVILTGFC